VTIATSPLADTFQRLRAFDELCRANIDVHRADGWLHLSDVPERGLDELFAAVIRPGPRRRDYAGATVAATLVDALVSTALPPLLLERRLPDVSPANVSVLLHETEWWFTQVSLHEPLCWVLPSDDAAADSSVCVVAEVAVLHRRLAVTLADAVTPWFDAIRARAPFGRRGMWGQLADDLCGSALWTARASGLDPNAAWREANAILDHVGEAFAELRVRPRRFPVRWSGGESLWQVKGTCCLWYTTADDHSDDDAFCTSCPLRPDDVRHERLRDWLETNAASEAS